MKYKEIYIKYVEMSDDTLSDFNEKQIETMLAYSYEDNHSSGIEECANAMFDIVSLCRDVVAGAK